MSIEQTVIPALAAATGVDVRSLHGEQLTDLLPAHVPLIVIARVSASWDDWDTFCTPNLDLANVGLQVDYYASTLEAARRLADIGRVALAQAAGSAPEGEFDSWDSGIRVYRVSASYYLPDYAPAIV